MTAQTGVATSWRITQHRALFRQFVHDNVRKFIGKIINHQQHAHSSAFLALWDASSQCDYSISFDLSVFPHMSHLFSDRQGLVSKQAIHVVCRDVGYGFPSPPNVISWIIFRFTNTPAPTKLAHKGARTVTCPFLRALCQIFFFIRWCLSPDTTLDHKGNLIPIGSNNTFWSR